MGADSSKEESRQNSPEDNRRRNQYVRQQRRQEPAYQATYQQQQQQPRPVPVERGRTPYSYTTEHLQTAATANILERSRTPYNYSSDELQHGVKQGNLYPNLNLEHADGYVHINYGQQSYPRPSAPPAPAPRELAPAAPAAPSTSSGYPSGPSQLNTTSANKNRPKSAVRNNDSLSCPTCSQRLGLAIFQCASGHSCCKDCKTAGRLCGDCLSPITDMRNIAVEALIAETRSSCQNPGCSLSFKLDEIERHLKECPFGEMDCPMGTFFGKCSTRCKVFDMASHFDDTHKEQRVGDIDKEMFVFNICMEAHKIYLLRIGPHTFLVHVKVGEKERKISMAVQLLGTGISAEKWTYEFHVYNKRQPMRKFLYVDTCKSISAPIDEVFSEFQCATLPLNYAMTFVNESALTYKFYIKKDMNQRGRRPRNNAQKST